MISKILWLSITIGKGKIFESTSLKKTGHLLRARALSIARGLKKSQHVRLHPHTTAPSGFWAHYRAVRSLPPVCAYLAVREWVCVFSVECLFQPQRRRFSPRSAVSFPPRRHFIYTKVCELHNYYRLGSNRRSAEREQKKLTHVAVCFEKGGNSSLHPAGAYRAFSVCYNDVLPRRPQGPTLYQFHSELFSFPN